jgi:hypothetical protein
VTQFANQIRAIGTAVERSQKDAVFRAAMVMKNSIEGERSKAMKGKDHFSRMTQKKTRSNRFVGVRPETNKLTVRFDVKGDYNPTALLVAKGPWGLIENGAVRHEITANLGSVKYTKGRGARKRAFKQRSLDIAFGATGLYAGMTPLGNRAGGFGPVYRVKDHPGTRGKQPWKRGTEKSRDQAAQMATRIVRNVVVDTIRAGRDSYVYVRGEEGQYRTVVG